MTWATISEDPNSEAVRSARWAKGRHLVAPANVHRTRDSVFLGAAAGRRVLDVGCVDHVGQEAAVGRPWLHAEVVRVADFVLGLDVLEDQVAKLRDRGFNVEAADVSNGRVVSDHPFEVVLAGEVIEHVEDPGALLRGLAANVADDGEVLVSTPNPFAPHRSRLGRRMVAWENADHLFYLFPYGMMELGERAGLQLAGITSCNHHRSLRSLPFAIGDQIRSAAHRLRHVRRRGCPTELMPTRATPWEWLRLRLGGELAMSGETLVYQFRRPRRAG